MTLFYNRKHTFIFVFFLLLFGMISCADRDAEILIDGDLTYPECGSVLPWEPPFATFVEDTFGAGLIRFQSAPGSVQDHLVIALPSVSEIRDSRGEELPISKDDPDQIHLSFDFRYSCQNSTISTASEGWIRFDKFNGEVGTVIAGAFELQVFDVRSDEQLAEAVSGEFEFTVRRFRPYQPFN